MYESVLKNLYLKVCLFAAASAAPAADADADPQLLYSAGVLPYAHHAVLPAVAPAVYKTAEVKSVVEKPAEVKVNTVAHPVVYSAPVVHTPAVYHSAALPVAHAVAPVASYYANSGGAVHVVKREADADAEAEADPYLYYSAYGYGYPYAGYRTYAGYYGGYRPYGYAYWG